MRGGYQEGKINCPERSWKAVPQTKIKILRLFFKHAFQYISVILDSGF